jgi:hypothetical protein
MDQDKPGDVETGTRDETYDIIAVLYHALQGAENCELYAEDAEDDQELRQYFVRAGQQQRQLADDGKRLLRERLMRQGQAGAGSSGGQSAFGQFGSQGSGSTGGGSPGASGSSSTTESSGGSGTSTF